jgi:hypothetical protein
MKVDADLDPEMDRAEDQTTSEPVEIIVLDPDERQWGRVTREQPRARASAAHILGELTMSLALRTARASISAGRSLYRAAADSGPGQLVTDAASGALGALGRNGAIDWDVAETRVEEQLGRVISIVAPVIVQSIDPEELLAALDIDALVDAVDVNALLDRVDVNGLLDRVDVDALLDRVDVNALLDRVEVDALLDRADVNALLDRADVNALLERADIDALLDRVTVLALIDRIDVDDLVARVDVNAVARRAQIGELVAESTSDVAGSALDVGRRQAVALDTLLARALDRVLGRDTDKLPQGPPALTETGDDAP